VTLVQICFSDPLVEASWSDDVEYAHGNGAWTGSAGILVLLRQGQRRDGAGAIPILWRPGGRSGRRRAAHGRAWTDDEAMPEREGDVRLIVVCGRTF
jgi:hypothetical protein